jgi:hypothetical protein
VCLSRLALSLVAALTSEDGRRAFVSGPLRLPRLKPSRRVLCTNPCTNLVTENLPVPAQMPGWEGVTVGSLAFAVQWIRATRRSIREHLIRSFGQAVQDRPEVSAL